MSKKNFSIPKLSKAKRGWYVHFRYCGIQKRFNGFGTVDCLNERELYYNELANQLHNKLKNGWNPLDETLSISKGMRLVDALEFSLQKKKGTIAPKTYSGYSGTVKFIKKAISSLSIDYLPIKDVKRANIRNILEKAKDQRKWTNKGYNKNLNYLSAIMDELLHWDIIEINPCTKIRRLREEESILNKTPTDYEFQKITSFLKENNYNFFVFVATIYSTGIRPKELLDVKVKDFDFNRNEIVLNSKTTKNRKSRRVPINEDLMIHFINIGLISDNLEFYLFGSFDYNHKHRNAKGLDFLVAPNHVKRDTATKLWFRIVKKYLKINISLYSMKHKGCEDMLKAGIDLDTIRHLFGHSSKRTTEIYAKDLTDVYKKDLLSKYPKIG